MRRLTWTGILLIVTGVTLLSQTPAQGARIKDIANIVGVRGNQLFGYGLVIGLDGTGDKQGTEFTIQSLANMLRKMGIQVDPDQVKVKNVAAVMVTAELPPFARAGMRLDVMVSSIGDAKTLQGGTLLISPLKGVDNNVYALAQGPVSIGGFSASAGGQTTQKNHPTVGRVPSGAVVEAEVPVPIQLREELEFVLRIPDFTTAEAMADAMNNRLGSQLAFARDSRTVVVKVPSRYQNRIVEYVSRLENVQVRTDAPARIVVNERTGTIVMGENVRISTVAVAHGGLSVMITEEEDVSQPSPFGQGKTTKTKKNGVKVAEEEARLMVLPTGISIGEVVKALNAVGVTPRDLIAIIQAIKNAGGLEAELIIM